MRGKIYKFFMILVVIGVILGLCINNIVLNRTIYSNEIHMKASEETYRNRTNKYNLDDMEKKLDMLDDKMENPEKYEKDDSDIVFKVYVPRFRILFSMNPLDLRFETKNYKVYLNNSIIENIKNQIGYISNMCQKSISKVTYNLSSSSEKLNTITSKIAALKTKIYYSIIK